MRDVFRTDLFELRVLLQIVVPVRQAEAALGGDADDTRGIVEVLHLTEAEHRIDADHLQVGDLALDVRETADTGDGVELRRERIHTDAIDELLVHPAGVEIADLLLRAAGRGMGLGGAMDELTDDLLVADLEDVERAPGGVGGGDRMALLPAAIRVAVEALCGAHPVVEPARVQRVPIHRGTGGERRPRQAEENPQKREAIESHRSSSVVGMSRSSAGCVPDLTGKVPAASRSRPKGVLPRAALRAAAD